jgi:hypothetical protein
MISKAREQVAQSELRGRQPVVDSGGAEVRGLTGDADVERQREAEAAADGGAVDGRDHRLMHLADREHDFVEELHRSQRDRRDRQTGDVRHSSRIGQIGSGAEAPAGAGDDDDTGVVVVADLLEGLLERDHHVERHGVHPLGPVQRDQGDVRARLLYRNEGHAPTLLGSAAAVDRDRGLT